MKKKKIDIFNLVNTLFLVSLALLCLIPLLHILAVSLSSSDAAATGSVVLWPKDFSLNSYSFVAKRPQFWRAMGISIARIGLGGFINTFLTILCAYPLAKPKSQFKYRTVYAWFFFITMLFNGGLIPSFLVVKQLGLIDTIWSLILPTAVPAFSVILLLNFFKQIPRSLDEAAEMDGASQWLRLWKIYVPLSTPAIATILLFSLVFHWNSWFDGLIYMNNPDNYPLQSYIQTIVVQKTFSQLSREEIMALSTISDKTLRSAQIFLGALPIVVVYPFLQRFFVKGITLGGVKE
ncbi:carbohydrate ABC transporter permease [Enterococcus casseliflavus]|uniref:carbohydrate ABC transporter permease n=1 Tax=Enterococcus casseliflavus TaxID=37734 RepID=UPI001CA90F57|nr:carbohydrate ABC transporter permease [Enterococcus casseliflavus]MBZ0323045.1 carbohydrate ABC transporter permease [Enterococcus casseliflavus]